jgi:pimeloyl-ACP methyl ester carboxylesterase
MMKIRTSLLEIAYRDDGPRDGHIVLLLHGWPDDPSTWDAVIPILNDAGLRTIAPTVRGFGEPFAKSPLYPDEQTSSDRADWSVSCQTATSLGRLLGRISSATRSVRRTKLNVAGCQQFAACVLRGRPGHHHQN